MEIDELMCTHFNKKCTNIFACDYLYHRFGVTKCTDPVLRQQITECVHNEELKARENISMFGKDRV